MINTVPSSNMVEVTLNNHVLSLWLTKDHGQVCHHGKNYTSMPIFQLELESKETNSVRKERKVLICFDTGLQ